MLIDVYYICVSVLSIKLCNYLSKPLFPILHIIFAMLFSVNLSNLLTMQEE
uniref:Uncharacterized protein sll1770-like n=1 Tax=Rhizophora mucronata TaxID=61149 RepID=A0A2P2MB92_RHIMU